MGGDSLSKENDDFKFITKSHLNVITEQVKIGFFEMDIESGEIRCTSRCKKNFGIAPDSSFSYMELLALILPEDLEAMQDEVDMALSGEKNGYHAIYRIKRPDGEIRWLKADGTVEKEGTTIISFVGCTQDITDIKK